MQMKSIPNVKFTLVITSFVAEKTQMTQDCRYDTYRETQFSDFRFHDVW